MELATAIFLFALYRATETFWKKGFDAAWDPVDKSLKKRFAHWAGTDQATQRQAAFTKAVAVARANTLRTAPDPQQTERILDALDSGRDQRSAEALAEEAAKLMLFSATPDVPRLTQICHRTIRFESLFTEEMETLPTPETVAVVLSDFLTNLRAALLDQEPYHDLIQKDMRRALNQILVELRPVPYDDETIYRSQVAEMYRELEFVGISELKEQHPITVEDIFIRLRIEQQIQTIPVWKDEGTIEPGQRWIEATTRILERFPTTTTRLQRRLEKAASFVTKTTVDQALRQTSRMVIVGDPGTGKTTLLKYLTVICAEGRSEAELGLKADGDGSLLPVFIPLREFAAECATRDQDYGLLDYLYTHAREHLLLHLPRGFFEEALKAGRCLVCLDGLDEVWDVGQRKTVTGAVKALAARFPHSRYAVASRIVGYDEAPLDRRDFAHHTILPLEDDDIHAFIHKWYHIRERDPVQRQRKAANLIATIEREQRIQALARNPLLLTIIALVHRIEAELPHERVKLYDKCVTTLVDTWEEVKGLTIAEKQRPFYRYRRRLLERLAFELHTRAEEPGQAATVREGDLERLLTNFLMQNRRLGFADDPDGAREEVRALIRLARGRTGLLIERGDKVFAFPHLTFQEYLTACEIEQRCFGRGADAVWNVIQHRLHDAHWREVILLLLGSLNKYEYDDPTTELVERILRVGEQDKFEPVLHRHLYLAIRALADRVDVAADLHQHIVSTTLQIARHAPEWEREDAFTALSWLKQDDYASDGLLALAQDDQVDAGVRRAAAQALGGIGRTGEAIEILLILARDDQVDAVVRSAAAQSLGKLGRTEEAMDILLVLARDGQVADEVRSAAAQALVGLGRIEKVAESLLALARDGQVANEVRSAAVQALGELGCTEDWVLDGLLTLTHDGQVDDEVRSAAAQVLGQLGSAEDRVVGGLLALTRDDEADDGVRAAAAQALGQLGRAEEAAEILLALVCDGQVNDYVRGTAAEALGQLGLAEDRVLDSLLGLARDGQADAWTRSIAAETLGQLGLAEEAAESLLALAHDDQVGNEAYPYIAQVLGGLGHAEEAAEILLALTCEDQVNSWIHSAIAKALGQLSLAESQVLDSLLALTRGDQVSDRVRCDAAQTLGQLGCAEEAAEILLTLICSDRGDTWIYRAEEAVEIILALARDGQVDHRVRFAAVLALGGLNQVEDWVLDGLLALTHGGQADDDVRGTAAEVLGQLGRAEDWVLDGLLALAHDDQASNLARRNAAQALCQLGRAEEAVKVLLALARDGQVDGKIRCNTPQALEGLDHTEDQVLDGLLALAHDDQVFDGIRGDATQALGELGHAEDRVLDGLLVLAHDSEVADWVRSNAAQALGRLGCAEHRVLDGLLALAQDSQVTDGLRSAAAQALGELGRAEEAVDILLTISRDCQVSDWARGNAAQALGELGCAEGRVLEALLALSHDGQVNDWVHSAATQALGKLGRAEEAAEDLLAMALDAQMADGIRRDAAQALCQLGRVEEAAQALLAMAHDAHDHMRRDAYESLKELVEGTVE